MTNQRIPLLRDALESSGLFMEGTEHFVLEPSFNSYYGFNVTKTAREPVDQIHGFIAAKRIQSHRQDLGFPCGSFFPFVAGIFEALNTKSVSELAALISTNRMKEDAKKTLFESILTEYQMEGAVLLTHDLWGDAQYWDILASMLKSGRYSKKSLTNDTLKWYKSEAEINEYQTIGELAPQLMSIPAPLLNTIESWPAPLLYTPIEVAEALFLKEFRGVKCKIGHMEEKVYDKYILPQMDVVHLRQPADLKSTRIKPRTVTPYIDKERRDPKLRVFWDDTDESLHTTLEQGSIEEYTLTLDPGVGEVLNPILDKLVLAVESARCMNLVPVRIAGQNIYDGSELIMRVAQREVSIQELAKDFPSVVSTYLIMPFARVPLDPVLN